MTALIIMLPPVRWIVFTLLSKWWSATFLQIGQRNKHFNFGWTCSYKMHSVWYFLFTCLLLKRISSSGSERFDLNPRLSVGVLKSSIPLVSFLESSAVDKGLEMGRVCGIPQCSGPRGLFQSTSRRTLRLPAGAAHACHLRPLAQVLPHDDLQQRARWTHTQETASSRVNVKL